MWEQIMNLPVFYSPVLFWLMLVCLFVIIEFVTISLTSIWFAGGALIALFVSLLGTPVYLQFALFFLVSVIMIFYTRPFAMKYVKPHNIKTNYEEAIGKEVQVTEQINNRESKGTVRYNGLEWSARSTEDDVVIAPGETVVVTEVRGVKLFVRQK